MGHLLTHLVAVAAALDDLQIGAPGRGLAAEIHGGDSACWRAHGVALKNQAKNVENVALHFRKNALLGPDRGECPRSATHQARAAAGRPFAWAILIVAISNVLGTKITSRWTTSVPHRPNHSPPQVRYSRYLVQGVARDMYLNKLPLSVDRNSTVTPSCLARPKQHRLDGGRADIDSRRHRHAAVSIAAPPS